MKQFKNTRSRSLVLTALAVVALIGIGREAPFAQSTDLAIVGGTLIDGTGAPARTGVNVIVLGSYSYDTQAGGNTTVPSFIIDKITRKGDCS